MVDVNTKIFDSLGTSVSEIIDKAAACFRGIYVMDIASNKVYAIKSINEKYFYDEPVDYEWDGKFLSYVNAVFAAKYRAMALVTFDRTHLSKKFTESNQKYECVYELNNGEWNNVCFQPLKIENGECKCVLVTFSDISESKAKFDEMALQMERFHKGSKFSNWYFAQVSQDMYSQILKFDLLTGDTSKIIFEDNEPKEVPVMNWNTIHDQLIDSIHPKDLEIASNVFSVDRIKSMAPGEMLECTFRRYIENKYHWYNMTIHVSELEPSVAVVFERDITASGVDINQTISKAEHDGLTDLFNIEKYGSLLPTEYASMESAGVIYADIEHLSEFNEKYGRDVGDEAIKILAESMRSVQNRQNLVYRCGDDEFMLISKNTSNEEIEILKQLVKERLSRLSDIRNVHFVASFGSAWETNVTDIAKVISTAVTDMRNNKTLELLH